MGYGLGFAIGAMLIAIYAGGKGWWLWLLGALCYFIVAREKTRKPKRTDHE